MAASLALALSLALPPTLALILALLRQEWPPPSPNPNPNPNPSPNPNRNPIQEWSSYAVIDSEGRAGNIDAARRILGGAAPQRGEAARLAAEVS